MGHVQKLINPGKNEGGHKHYISAYSGKSIDNNEVCEKTSGTPASLNPLSHSEKQEDVNGAFDGVQLEKASGEDVPHLGSSDGGHGQQCKVVHEGLAEKGGLGQQGC